MDKDSPKEEDKIEEVVKTESKKTRLVVLISAVGIVLFIFVVATLPFKDQLFQALYPKPQSLAVDPIDDLTNQLLQVSREYNMALTESGIEVTATPSATPPVTDTPSSTPVSSSSPEPSATPSASHPPTSSPTPSPTATSIQPTVSGNTDTGSSVKGEKVSQRALQKQDEMVTIAKRRKELLLEKMRSNPQEFLNKATLADKRDSLPEEVKLYIEEKIQVDGKLILLHADDFQNNKSSEEYFVEAVQEDKKAKTNLKRYKLNLSQKPKLIPSSQVKINTVAIGEDAAIVNIQDQTGKKILGINNKQGSVLAEQTNIGTLQIVSTPTYSSLTSGKVAVLMVKFAETTQIQSGFTTDNLNKFMSTASNSVKKFYETSSFGKMQFSADVFGIYTLQNTICDNYTLAVQVDALAANNGVNLGSYDKKLYIFLQPYPGCLRTQAEINGRGWVAGNDIYLNDTFNIATNTRTTIHELGHMFYSWHANTLYCGGSEGSRLISQDTSCQYAEYQDISDVMGSGGAGEADFNGSRKAGWGWIPASNVVTVNQSGIYTIAPTEVGTNSAQILRIPKPNSTEVYHISYRQQIGNDAGSNLLSTYARGVSIHLWDEAALGISDTRILAYRPAARPYPENISDALTDNEQFIDQKSGITIKQLNHTLASNSNPGNVTVQITLPIPTPDTSKRVFVTSITTNGNIKAKAQSLGITLTNTDTGLIGADKICKHLADNSPVNDMRGRAWKAWLSDRNNSAKDRLEHISVSYKLPNNLIIASDWNDLTDGSISKSIDVTEQNQTLTTSGPVITATNITGEYLAADSSNPTDCQGFTSSVPETAVWSGSILNNDNKWTRGIFFHCNVEGRLYCFEQTTAASPTPSPTPVVKTPPCEIYGDLNLDGRVTIEDVQIVLDIYLGKIIIQVTKTSDNQYMRVVGDVNGDNSITPDDARLIQRYIDGLDSSFPVCTNAKASPCNNIGDVTTDGKISFFDSHEALRIYTGYTGSLYTNQPYTSEQRRRADVDSINGVTSTDASMIQQYLNGKITTFPACSSPTSPTSTTAPASVQTSATIGCTPCSADINGDKRVSIVDYSGLLLCFNKRSTDRDFRGNSCSTKDINGDGSVNRVDFNCLKSQFGKRCTQ